MIYRSFCVFLFVFGVATLKEGGAVLFFDSTARADAGNTVPFVLWFNFAAGFFYLATSILAWKEKKGALALAQSIAVGTLLIWIGLIIHIFMGFPYETRTLVAHTLRASIWVGTVVLFSKKFKAVSEVRK